MLYYHKRTYRLCLFNASRLCCSTPSLAFIYDSFLLHIIPGTQAPKGFDISCGAVRKLADTCSMVDRCYLLDLLVNPDAVTNRKDQVFSGHSVVKAKDKVRFGSHPLLKYTMKLKFIAFLSIHSIPTL